MCDCTTRLRADAERLLAQGDRLKAQGHHKNAEASRRHAMSLALAVGHLNRPPERPMTVDTLVTIAPCKRTIACTLEADHHGVCRDRWTKPLIQPPGGKKPVAYFRATKFVDVVEDRYNLERWQMRNVAVGLATSPDLLLKVAGTSLDDKDTLNDLCQQAINEAKANAKRDRGTLLHKLTEYADRGLDLPPDTLPEDRAAVQAYIKAVLSFSWLHIEQLTVLDRFKVAGTPDRIGYVPEPDPDGVVGNRIIDLKSGNMAFGQLKTAGQLALYSRSELLDPVTWARSPLPEVNRDWGVVLDMDAEAGTVDLRWINLSLGWQVVEEATRIRELRAVAKTAFRPFQRGFPNPDEAIEQKAAIIPEPMLMELIDMAPDADAVRVLWAGHQHRWTDRLTEYAKARIARGWEAA